MSANASPSAPVFQVDDVTKSFGAVAALRGATLRCPRGEVTALVGDNGVGRSTLARCMTRVHRPDGGTMRFEGREVHFGSPEDVRALGIETVFRDLALVEDLTVRQNMYLDRKLGRGRGPLRILDRKAMAGAKKTIERLLVDMPPSADATGEPARTLAPHVAVVDTTGAGDAFAGALALELARGARLEAAVEVAVRAGSFAVKKYVAQASLPARSNLTSP